ncbi:hypothetical protein GJ744_011768 [Endocarpon pusillum]|uniref:Uncharacterized protein n=1 Tax=Endocarpon pusillum TaxID=364733 RepID=A0A8H7AE57_9EURO|nr:hypothetical protein GJ744_011768 [Endocarpon pusillum]
MAAKETMTLSKLRSGKGCWISTMQRANTNLSSRACHCRSSASAATSSSLFSAYGSNSASDDQNGHVDVGYNVEEVVGRLGQKSLLSLDLPNHI